MTFAYDVAYMQRIITISKRV